MPLLLLVVSALGCGNTYSTLADEDALPDLAAMKRAAAGVPARTVRVPVWHTRAGREVRVAVHESGWDRNGRVVVLVHGVFSDAGAWRFVRGGLAGDYHVIAIDLPGCGASDAPDPDDLPPDAYGLDSLARAVLLALRQTLPAQAVQPAGPVPPAAPAASAAAAAAAATQPGAPRPPPVTLVGHSLGGAAILRALGAPALRAEFADVVGRVDGAVLFAPADVVPASNQDTFDELGEIDGLDVWLAERSGMLRERVAQAVRGGATDPARALRQEVDRSAGVLRDPWRRRAMQAMVARALPIVNGPDEWAQADALERDYANVTAPCLLVWGRRDDACPVAMGYKLAAQLPHARLRILNRGRHSLPVDEPAACAGLIKRWIETGMSDEPRIATVGE
jgi:pimeloyl-ACP methyl ester carboxylesterase